MKRPLLVITACLCLISLGIAAVPFADRMFNKDDPVLTSFTATAEPAPLVRADLEPILAFAPFGRAVPVEQPGQPVPITSTGLTLLGITSAEPQSQSRAIIAGGDLAVASYGAGAAITSNVQLNEVGSDHVILSVDGQQEALYFVQGASAAQGSLDLEFLIVPKAPAPGTDEQTDTILSQYRADLHENPQTLLDSLGVQAVEGGYLVTEFASQDVLQAGFMPGDLVTAINGQTVGDVAEDTQYFDNVAASDRAAIEVQRSGQTIMITLPLQ